MSENTQNYGPGGFSDQYDNEHMKSVDRDQHPGGVTETPFEDDMDLMVNNFNPAHGEAYIDEENQEPARADEVRETGGDPVVTRKTDEQLRADVLHAFKNSLDLKTFDLDVTVNDGVVTLKGNISSDNLKNVAIDLTDSIPGVVDVFIEPRSSH